MKEIKLGCPMEYEVDNVIHNGLFLRENEVKIVFKELEKINKQRKIIDKAHEKIILRKNEISGLLFKELLEILEEIEWLKYKQ